MHIYKGFLRSAKDSFSLQTSCIYAHLPLCLSRRGALPLLEVRLAVLRRSSHQQRGKLSGKLACPEFKKKSQVKPDSPMWLWANYCIFLRDNIIMWKKLYGCFGLGECSYVCVVFLSKHSYEEKRKKTHKTCIWIYMCNVLENNQMKGISSDKSLSHVQRRGLAIQILFFSLWNIILIFWKSIKLWQYKCKF